MIYKLNINVIKTKAKLKYNAERSCVKRKVVFVLMLLTTSYLILTPDLARKIPFLAWE
jgi:hypothetical protein